LASYLLRLTSHAPHAPTLLTLHAFLALFPAPANATQDDIRRDATVTAVEQVMPSVVNIATETVIEYHDFYEELLRQFYGWTGRPRQEKYVSLGSGVIIDEDGYVLTNFHVIRRASRIQVKLWDQREYEADALFATEHSDVALMKIRSKPGEKFKAIKLAPDDDLLLGETVLAVGNPYGLGGTVTRGILSSKNRRPATGNEPLNVQDWLQTDAAINPGNSGGPLVNLRGELIGLNVAVYREQQGGEHGMGVGFSIPVKQVSAALARFFTPEVTDSLWFGAQVKPGPGPLVITSVQPASPAAKAGLREGDHVLQVNGQAPTGIVTFNHLLATGATNDLRFVVSRGEARRIASVRLRPLDELFRQKLGCNLLELTAQTAARLGVKAGEGLFVEEVERGGPADQARLQRGYLLSEVDGQAAGELRVVAEILSSKKPGDTVHLAVIVPRRIGAYVEFRQGAVDVVVR
jgi:S1-C subfamily serine protease